MLPSRHPSSGDSGISRRVRHLTTVQVCNLSPFPARDTFASALAQPSGQSQFTPHGGFSDDLDIALNRKRRRRVSSVSSTASRVVRRDPDIVLALEQPNIQHKSPSRSKSTSVSPTVAQRRATGASSTPGIRSSTRPRTVSTTSVSDSTQRHPSNPAPSSSVVLPSLLRDTSQTTLECVYQSRLVETYVKLSLVQSQDSHTPLRDHVFAKPHRNAPLLRRHVPTMSTSHIPFHNMTSPPSSHGRSVSMSPVSDSKGGSYHWPPSHELAPRKQATPGSTRLPDKGHEVIGTSQITYYSAVHRPSTNPCFNIDLRPELGNTTDPDLSGSQLHIELWGSHLADTAKLGSSEQRLNNPLKSKEKKNLDPKLDPSQWRVLERWDLDLNALVPLVKESDTRWLPSNTIIVTLSPPGQRFYFPPHDIFQEDPDSLLDSRPPSPSAGYNSDPETELRKSKDATALTRREHTRDSSSGPFRESNSVAKLSDLRWTANWQELLKLTTLQTVILDTQKSLFDIVREIDVLVAWHPVSTLVSHSSCSHPKTIWIREVSERRAGIRQVEAEKGTVLDECQNLRNQIDSKREALRIRKHLLKEAQSTLVFDNSSHATSMEVAGEEQRTLCNLRGQLHPLRSAALATLASIYPIELLSPPELLFTILDVPLPIPVGAMDPAPPTSLPAFKTVNEDTVATALGYAAHVVQLMALYTNKHLTYPITYIGSRSLIKDSISAMVGPRMFPLFSKGVDAYRFEYGVFLLNKNIETLMMDRDLRALDMRHTLPNLKNLLLTLTDFDITPNKRVHRRGSTSTRAEVDRPTTSATAKIGNEPGLAQGACDDAPAGDPAAGATSAATKKPRTFLDLAPLTGFLRGRYPSTSKLSGQPGPQLADPTMEANGGRDFVSPADLEHDDEDDRRTIQAVPVGPGVPPEESKVEDPIGTVQEEIVIARSDTAEKVAGSSVLLLDQLGNIR